MVAPKFGFSDDTRKAQSLGMTDKISIWQKIYWNVMHSVSVQVKWPERFEYEHTGFGDPNLHYRPWLEEHVGKQGIAWEWGMSWNQREYVYIFLPRHKKEFATMIKLMWA